MHACFECEASPFSSVFAPSGPDSVPWEEICGVMEPKQVQLESHTQDTR